MEFLLLRDDNPASPHNYGRLFQGDKKLGETLEDSDRRLEDGGEKIYGDTAIPRGRYKLELLWSNHFKRLMPHITGVPTHDHVMVHGGNREVDTLGCPLLGAFRTLDGIAGCAKPNEVLMNAMLAAKVNDEECWITVK